MIVSVVLVDTKTKCLKRVIITLPWKQFLLYIIISSLIIVPLLSATVRSTVGFESTYLNAWIRHRSDHIPSSFDRLKVLSDGLLFSVLFANLFKYKDSYIPNKRNRLFSLTFVLSGVMIMAFGGFIFTEIFPVGIIIDLQPLRVELYIYLILFGALAKSIVVALNESITHFGPSSINSETISVLLLSVIVIIGTVGWGTAFVAFDAGDRDVQWIKTPGSGHPVEDKDYSVYGYIENNTPRNSTFLIPPSHGRFRLGTSRAAVVTWKQFPFQAEESVEWRERMEDVCQMDISEIQRNKSCSKSYSSLSKEQIRNLSAKYNADYILTKNDSYSFSNRAAIDGYYVYRITD
jgi:hypothetical protein